MSYSDVPYNLETSKHSSKHWPTDDRGMDSRELVLCPRCQTIDFDALNESYAQKFEDYFPIRVRRLPLLGLTSGCPLCDLFATMSITGGVETNCDLMLTKTKLEFFGLVHDHNYGSYNVTSTLGNTLLFFLEPGGAHLSSGN